MKRRDFTALSTSLAALPVLGALPNTAAAQGGQPAEGTHYVRVAQPAPTGAPKGKVEVVEFFWYGCPHCYAFEPIIGPWSKALPADVAFRRVHVGFTALHQTHQKLYYSLETLGAVDQLHAKVFNAIHQQRRRLDKEADLAAFAAENGIDGGKFLEVFKSFGVQTKARQATQLSEAYKIDGVPTLGVQGRFWTSATLAGNFERSLAVTDFLVQRVKAGG
ncbi:thiol:disulfide interchange protein DsbA/DsbL [Aquabacterium sp. J223]|uniref:thiol:disulfide interchange protein DsbA/DsbL n=1 Tax=Aquabacterium sp. J223 TaxID=2898431 RepID=UPI0021AD6425|nr:thiol:disulfide interchange protein DsbA/DsbL [Aquabacterium sp. J223]UUX95865.1 thiol:disulfide interchange protein DsbA/DsbL [Aquabacterium sp. J223]